MEDIKKVFQKIEKDKEELKINVLNIFTKIRNTLNEREEELLKEIDNIFDNKYINRDIIKKVEKLPNQIKLSLEKGKLIDKEWDENNIYSYINDCINIENNIKIINIIQEHINKYRTSNKINIIFSPSQYFLNNFLESIKSFGKIDEYKYSFKEFPTDNKEDKKFIITGKDKNIITKIGKSENVGTICEFELDKSIEEHKWKIKFLKTKNKNINVGVASIDFDFHSNHNFDSNGWYLYCKELTLFSGLPFKYSYKKTNFDKLKDEIVVVINMKKRTLKFIINNEDKGDSYKDIPIDKPIYPAVLLYDVDDSVEISNIL